MRRHFGTRYPFPSSLFMAPLWLFKMTMIVYFFVHFSLSSYNEFLSSNRLAAENNAHKSCVQKKTDVCYWSIISPSSAKLRADRDGCRLLFSILLRFKWNKQLDAQRIKTQSRRAHPSLGLIYLALGEACKMHALEYRYAVFKCVTIEWIVAHRWKFRALFAYCLPLIHSQAIDGLPSK